MLRHLHIENYVLIDKLDLDFAEGFSAVTGQTGAGKSILLGALGLVLGNRADLKSISEDKDRCIIEAEFDISDYGLEHFFEENDLEYSDYCILRRELYRSGKSRNFLNDSPAAASILRALGERLIDIHSQHNNLLLKDSSFQTSILDAAAQNAGLLDEYRIRLKELQQKRKELDSATESIQSAKADYDYISHQYRQLESANLKEGEEKQLEEDMKRLEHASDIETSLAESNECLSGDNGIISMLKAVVNRLSHISSFDQSFKEIEQRMESCRIEIKDIAEEISSALDASDTDPEKLQKVQDRFDLLYDLMQKHKVNDTSGLLQLQAEYKKRLEQIETGDEKIGQLAKEVSAAEEAAMQAAEKLSTSRRKVVPHLEQAICSMLEALGMPNARFAIDMRTCGFTPSGIDEINFLFSSNRQNAPRAVSQIASGGEISRIMLCIKAQMARFEHMPTMIFDEIDTGVSGEVAARMGKIMKDISANTQVICITHLPQVACKAARQYKVYKTEECGNDLTRVKLLDKTERITEIAQMLSGENLSEAAIKNAQDLLGINS